MQARQLRSRSQSSMPDKGDMNTPPTTRRLRSAVQVPVRQGSTLRGIHKILINMPRIAKSQALLALAHAHKVAVLESLDQDKTETHTPRPSVKRSCNSSSSSNSGTMKKLKPNYADSSTEEDSDFEKEKVDGGRVLRSSSRSDVHEKNKAIGNRSVTPSERGRSVKRRKGRPRKNQYNTDELFDKSARRNRSLRKSRSVPRRIHNDVEAPLKNDSIATSRPRRASSIAPLSRKSEQNSGQQTQDFMKFQPRRARSIHLQPSQQTNPTLLKDEVVVRPRRSCTLVQKPTTESSCSSRTVRSKCTVEIRGRDENEAKKDLVSRSNRGSTIIRSAAKANQSQTCATGMVSVVVGNKAKSRSGTELTAATSTNSKAPIASSKARRGSTIVRTVAKKAKIFAEPEKDVPDDVTADEHGKTVSEALFMSNLMPVDVEDNKVVAEVVGDVKRQNEQEMEVDQFNEPEATVGEAEDVAPSEGADLAADVVNEETEIDIVSIVEASEVHEDHSEMVSAVNSEEVEELSGGVVIQENDLQSNSQPIDEQIEHSSPTTTEPTLISGEDNEDGVDAMKIIIEAAEKRSQSLKNEEKKEVVDTGAQAVDNKTKIARLANIISELPGVQKIPSYEELLEYWIERRKEEIQSVKEKPPTVEGEVPDVVFCLMETEKQPEVNKIEVVKEKIEVIVEEGIVHPKTERLVEAEIDVENVDDLEPIEEVIIQPKVSKWEEALIDVETGETQSRGPEPVKEEIVQPKVQKIEEPVAQEEVAKIQAEDSEPVEQVIIKKKVKKLKEAVVEVEKVKDQGKGPKPDMVSSEVAEIGVTLPVVQQEKDNGIVFEGFDVVGYQEADEKFKKALGILEKHCSELNLDQNVYIDHKASSEVANYYVTSEDEQRIVNMWNLVTAGLDANGKLRYQRRVRSVLLGRLPSFEISDILRAEFPRCVQDHHNTFMKCLTELIEIHVGDYYDMSGEFIKDCLPGVRDVLALMVLRLLHNGHPIIDLNEGLRVAEEINRAMIHQICARTRGHWKKKHTAAKHVEFNPVDEIINQDVDSMIEDCSNGLIDESNGQADFEEGIKALITASYTMRDDFDYDEEPTTSDSRLQDSYNDMSSLGLVLSSSSDEADVGDQEDDENILWENPMIKVEEVEVEYAEDVVFDLDESVEAERSFSQLMEHELESGQK